MRVALRLPDHRPERGSHFASAVGVTEVAAAAEAAGFDAVFVTDHPIPSPDFGRVGGHHSFEPFVTLAYVAGVTERLRLLTFLVVLPYRNPFVTAKAVATLDVVSGGRLILGVGAGYMQEEFQALGVNFAERNELVDEAIDVMKLAWTGEPVVYSGRHFNAVGNVSLPVPVQRPHPPIWVGGNSNRAIRRAVERGDGRMPFAAPPARAQLVRTAALEGPDDLKRALETARVHAAAVGRTNRLDVAFTPLGRTTYTEVVAPGRVVEAAAELAAVGVTYLTMQFPVATRAELLVEVDRFGCEAIRDIAGLTSAAAI